MITSHCFISHIDQTKIHYIKVTPNHYDKTLVFIHGMEDDKKRYLDFARKISDSSCQVYLLDLRGHGDSKVEGKLGYFGPKEGWMSQILDIKQLIDTIDGSVILMGHSMGSLFVRAYLKRYPETLNLVILSGTPANQQVSQIVNRFLKCLLISHQTKQKPNQLLQKIMITGFNQKIKNPKTSFDWLSFNEENIQSYIENPLCGFPFSTQGFIDLFDLLKDVNDTKILSQSKSLKVLMMSGQHDPCGLIDKGKIEAVQQLLQLQHHDVTLNYYPHSRHEILFDEDQEQVIQDIQQFIKNI